MYSLSLLIYCKSLCLLVILLYYGHCFSRLRKLTTFHSLHHEPMDKSVFAVHAIELISYLAKHISYGRRVADHTARSFSPCQVSLGNEGQGRTAETYFETCGAPICKLD
jgi:hypothetical protein